MEEGKEYVDKLSGNDSVCGAGLEALLFSDRVYTYGNLADLALEKQKRSIWKMEIRSLL